MKRKFSFLLLGVLIGLHLLIAGLLMGCGTLDGSGVYRGDKALYAADRVIVASYETLHAFVRWEYQNRETLAQWPEIKETADAVRLNAQRWISTATVLRDAYKANPTKEARAELARAVEVLQAAVVETSKYINKP